MSLFFVDSLANDSSESLRSEVREIVGDRKILRFLSPQTLPAFACAVQAANLIQGIDPKRITLFTVSGWESLKEFVPSGHDPEEKSRDKLRRLFYSASNPTTALSMLGNAPLCQAGIATKIQGPSMHVMGDGADFFRLMVIAGETFREDTAEAAILVAFDVEAAESDVVSRARAIVLSPNASGARASVDVLSPVAARDTLAIAAVESCIDAVERCNSDEATDVVINGQLALRVQQAL